MIEQAIQENWEFVNQYIVKLRDKALAAEQVLRDLTDMLPPSVKVSFMFSDTILLRSWPRAADVMDLLDVNSNAKIVDVNGKRVRIAFPGDVSVHVEFAND